MTARFPWISADAFQESIQVVRLEDGKSWSGAAAIEQLLQILPGGGAAAWLFHVPLGRRVADALYRAFARNRQRLGCGRHCRTD